MVLYKQVSGAASLFLLLGVSVCCAQFTVFNTTDDAYELTLTDGAGQRIAVFEVEPHSKRPVAEIKGLDALQVTYHVKRTLWQEFLQPFRNFLSTVGLGKGPLQDQMTVVRPVENQTIAQNSNLIISKDSQDQVHIALAGPMTSKKLIVDALQARAARA